MEEANTLAYYDAATIAVVKSFIVPAPGVSIISNISLTIINPDIFESNETSISPQN
jgi:hypothetical protein